MAHLHANGDEEQRPRTEAELAAINEQNRIAAQSNLRSGKDRRVKEPYVTGNSKLGLVVLMSDGRTIIDRRSYRDQRQVVSSFERDLLLSGVP